MHSRKRLNEITKKHFNKRVKFLTRQYFNRELESVNENPNNSDDGRTSDEINVATSESESEIENNNVIIDNQCLPIGLCDPSEKERDDLNYDDLSELIEYNENEEINLNPHELPSTPITDDEIVQKIAKWNCDNNVTVKCSNEILKIFRNAGHKIPIDIRTVKKCEKIKVTSDKFVYIGIKSYLIEYYKKLELKVKKVFLTFNVDGVPLSNSGNSQLWPILAYFSDENVSFTSPVFTVAAYHSTRKPKPEELFDEFITECNILLNEGIEIENEIVNVEIRAFICDAPAKSLITGTKNFNGYSGCSKCVQEGEYIKNRVTFPETEAPLRTNENFRNKVFEDHHNECSPLESLAINMVDTFPLDYMHLICLGVVKKLISNWLSGNLKCRLSSSMIADVSKRIEVVANKLPVEFNRKVRRLEDFSRWKATECRSFLLYIGHFALKGILNDEYYKHFMELSVAISILISDEHKNKITVAEKLLKNFVQNSKRLYGDEFLIYNIHNLIHLTNDVKRFGILDKFSAFVFENHLGQLIKLIKKGNQTLQQLVNRLLENREFGTQYQINLNNNNELKLPQLKKEIKNSNSLNFEQCIFKEFSIKINGVNNSNNIVILKNGIFAKINKIFKNQNKVFLTGNLVTEKDNMFELPIKSKRLGKFTGKLQTTETTFSESEIVSKGMSYNYNGRYYFSSIFNTARE